MTGPNLVGADRSERCCSRDPGLEPDEIAEIAMVSQVFLVHGWLAGMTWVEGGYRRGRAPGCSFDWNTVAHREAVDTRAGTRMQDGFQVRTRLLLLQTGRLRVRIAQRLDGSATVPGVLPSASTFLVPPGRPEERHGRR